jgi:hypothetical protein
MRSLAKRTAAAVEEASWLALKAPVFIYARKKGRVDDAVSVRFTALRARGRLRFRFDIPRVFQTRPLGLG